ncbi:hypothetical protein G6F63_014953 [Rhizopus arrhizus]|nr:hypothetical protein G6F63_014953 [Rhizopus arrhizus]
MRGAARAFLAGLCVVSGEALAKRPEIIVDPGGVPPAALQAITEAIAAGEQRHGGQVMFAVEADLPLDALVRTIEIDQLDALGERPLPEPLLPQGYLLQ